MIEVPDFLPLGSIVKVEGAPKKLMIVSRGLVFQKDDGQKEYYDYGLCLYPEGLIGDSVIFTNHDRIVEVVFEGCEDEENEKYVQVLSEILPKASVKKGDPRPESEW